MAEALAEDEAVVEDRPSEVDKTTSPIDIFSPSKFSHLTIFN